MMSCSGQDDPVAENALAPPDSLVGDASAEGLADPANSGRAEAVQQAALPGSTDGLRWSWRDSDRTALFGPAATPAFSIRCEGGKLLVFERLVPAPAQGKGTLSFTGNGAAASLPVVGIRAARGIDSHWRVEVPRGDMARDVAKTFEGSAAVNLSIGGTPSLVVPPSPLARKVLADCLS